MRLILCSFVVAALAMGSLQAATLYLPRQFEPSEMPTVGIALVNPTTATASVTFRLKSAEGLTLATVQRTIPAKGQFAATLDQIFTGGGSGYMAADVDNYDVTGFWMTGNFVTSTDGAPLLRGGDAAPYSSFSYFEKASVISLVNTASTAVSGSLNLEDGDGTTVTSVTFQIPASGLLQRSVASLFPAQADSFDTTAYSIAVSPSNSDAQIIGTTVTPSDTGDNVITNATTFVDSQLTFPQIVDGPVGGTTYRSLLTVSNPRSTGKTLTITLKTSSGSTLTVQREIQPFGILRFRVIELFNIASVDGWLSVTTDTDYVTGWVTYTDLNKGGTTAVQGQFDSDTTLIFGHIADLSPWWTGIGLVNTSSSNAQIEVYAMDSSGRLIAGPRESAAASFTLAAGSKRAFLLGDVLSQTQSRRSDGGYVYVRSTNAVPIYGVELFFLRSGLVYSNVPATLLAGLPFTPPGASTSGPASIQEVYTGDANNQRKTSFRPGDAITLNMVIANTTGQTINVIRRYRAIAPQMDPFVDFMFAGTLDANTTTRFTSDTIPSSAVPGTYTFTGTIEYNGVQSSGTTSFSVSASSASTQRTLMVTKSGNGSVTSDPSGINCGSTCTAQYSDGTRVVLTATPSSGSVFSGWSGACTGAATCVVTMDADKNVTGIFDTATSGPSTQVLQVFKQSTGGGSGSITSSPEGIVCGANCGAHFAAGGQVVLTVVPDAGTTFTGWTGDCASTSSASTTAPTAFPLRSTTVPGVPGGGGSGGSSAPAKCTVVMSGDKRVTANFTKPTSGEGGPSFSGATGIRLNVYASPSLTSVAGTITSNPGGVNCTNRDVNGCFTSFALGLPVILTATAAPGWTFTGWGGNGYYSGQTLISPAGDCTGTAPCTVVAWGVGFGGSVTATFRSTSTGPPPPPPNYCNVSCSGACFNPAVNFQSNFCAACAAVYNACVATQCAGDHKYVLYWNACH